MEFYKPVFPRRHYLSTLVSGAGLILAANIDGCSSPESKIDKAGFNSIAAVSTNSAEANEDAVLREEIKAKSRQLADLVKSNRSPIIGKVTYFVSVFELGDRLYTIRYRFKDIKELLEITVRYANCFTDLKFLDQLDGSPYKISLLDDELFLDHTWESMEQFNRRHYPEYLDHLNAAIEHLQKK